MPRLPAKLECADPTVAPGSELRCRLLVYNAAERVDEMQVKVRGPLAAWARVPRELVVMPRTEDAFDVTIALPADAEIVAGTQPLLVEAHSGLSGTEPSLEELDIEITARTDVSLSLHQRAPRGGEGRLEAAVDNRSNHPVSLDIEVDARVRTQVRPSHVEVAPFDTAASRITVHRDADDRAPVPLVVRGRGSRVEVEASTTWSGHPATPRHLRLIAGATAAVVLIALLLTWDPFGIFSDENTGDGPGTTDRITTEATTPPVLEPEVDDFPVLATRQNPDERLPWDATWQAMLDARGYELGDVDGRFGPRTEAATEQFQDAEGLTIDGTVDPPDWGRMLRLYRDTEDPTVVINWHQEAARELTRLLGLEGELAPVRQCGEIDEVVTDVERTDGTVRLTLAATSQPPC